MKCFAALLAVLMATAAQSQIASDPQGTPSEQTAAQPVNSPGVTSSPVTVSAADLNTASNTVKDAWNDFTGCRRPSACKAYFESFGVAISFADGSISPFSHMQRLTATSRDCIKNARASLEQGNRSMAVQWVMAARIENPAVRDWLGNHPDAVLEALRRCCW
jgi:hypothetical protein